MTVRYRPIIFVVGLIILAGSIVLTFIFASVPGLDADLRKSLLAGAITLGFGTILGGFGKLLLDDFDRGRQQSAEYAQFITNVLADLKAVYDRVERARVLIPAHQSVATFGNEMRDLIEARVKLLNVSRALFQHDKMSEVRKQVDGMAKYLQGLIQVFQSQYKGLSMLQREHEARVDASLEEMKKDPKNGTGYSGPNKPWDTLSQLKEVREFLNLDSIGNHEASANDAGTTYHPTYKSQFLDHLDYASETLRDELRQLLGGGQ